MVISDVDTGEFIAKKIIYDQSVTRVHSECGADTCWLFIIYVNTVFNEP